MEKLKTLFSAVVEAVMDAEDSGGEGQDKLDAVLDAVVIAIKTPLGDTLERAIVGLLVELLVYVWNRYGWPARDSE